MYKYLTIFTIIGCLSFVVGYCVYSDVHGPKHYKKFKLDTGEIVECEVTIRETCGMTMMECKDGNQYICQINIVLVGKNYLGDTSP